MKLLLIDNYDSFTYNLVQYFAELGASVEVVRNDEITLPEIAAFAPDLIAISPGPGTPTNTGVCLAMIAEFGGQIPLLGVCLGHQSIAYAAGGNIVTAGSIMHGKTSPIFHHNKGIFQGIPQGFTATRYHSLVVERASLPDCLEITAWTQNASGNIDEIMGLRHRNLAMTGVQFHPESILSEHGHTLLNNFLHQTL